MMNRFNLNYLQQLWMNASPIQNYYNSQASGSGGVGMNLGQNGISGSGVVNALSFAERA